MDLTDEALELGHCVGPKGEPAAGIIRDDVRRLASRFDDPVEERACREFRPGQGGRMIEEDQRVEGVPALEGRGRGMGLLAEEFDDERAAGQGLPHDGVDGVRMDLEDDVGMRKNPVLDHADLAAAAFFGRSPDDLDRAGGFSGPSTDFRTTAA